MYVKCTENSSSESKVKGSSIWNFPFTEGQIDGKDNTFKVRVKNVDELFGREQMDEVI